MVMKLNYTCEMEVWWFELCHSETIAVTDRGSWGSHRERFREEREGKEARKEERWAMFMWYKFKQQIHKEGQRRVSCHTTEITGEM